MSKNGNKAEKPVRAERKATFAGALIAFLLCVAVIMGGIVCVYPDLYVIK